ncbi:hypothetical protein C7999DRAFT_18290 [Corynascus novoguineensis]|uniref:Secreted protein n=1 Tax=Corynascus novoguineensis TaxID=1126955 RepID=A0AAN7HIM5_9PEZI|nr:hypothetical protein C7999DRAFT_18290 [Corynascus novoguineensis]
MKYVSSLLLATSLAVTQTTTLVNIMMPLVNTQPIGASVISAGPTAIDYFVTCPSSIDQEKCGLADGITVLYGPSTMTYGISYSKYNTMSANCKLNPTKNVADCIGQHILDGKTTVVHGIDENYSELIKTVPITAGVEKLSATGSLIVPTTCMSISGVPQITQNVLLKGAAALVGGVIPI